MTDVVITPGSGTLQFIDSGGTPQSLVIVGATQNELYIRSDSITTGTSPFASLTTPLAVWQDSTSGGVFAPGYTTGANSLTFSLGTSSYRWDLFARNGDFSGTLNVTGAITASSHLVGANSVITSVTPSGGAAIYGALTVAGAGGISVTGSGQTLTVNAGTSLTIAIGTTTIIGGSTPGSVLFVGASNVLAQTATGTSGYFLQSAGTGNPVWANTTATPRLDTLTYSGSLVAAQLASTDFVNAAAMVSRMGLAVTGGGAVSWLSNVFAWSNRFIIISSGYGSNSSTAGYFDITMPTSGSVALAGGASARSWSASGITLNAWDALYYALPLGSANTSLPANFTVVSYSSTFVAPAHWVLVAVNNSDTTLLRVCNGVTLANGQTLAVGSSTPSATGSSPQVAYYSGASTLTGSSALTFSSGVLSVGASGAQIPTLILNGAMSQNYAPTMTSSIVHGYQRATTYTPTGLVAASNDIYGAYEPFTFAGAQSSGSNVVGTGEAMAASSTAGTLAGMHGFLASYNKTGTGGTVTLATGFRALSLSGNTANTTSYQAFRVEAQSQTNAFGTAYGLYVQNVGATGGTNSSAIFMESDGTVKSGIAWGSTAQTIDASLYRSGAAALTIVGALTVGGVANSAYQPNNSTEQYSLWSYGSSNPVYTRKVGFFQLASGLEGGVKADSVLYLTATNGLTMLPSGTTNHSLILDNGGSGSNPRLYTNGGQALTLGFDVNSILALVGTATHTLGKTTFSAATSSYASLNIPNLSVAPSTPASGDVWHDATATAPHLYFLDGNTQTRDLLQGGAINLSRAAPTIVNNWVEIGNLSIGSGGHNVIISVVISSSGYSTSKTYVLTAQYGTPSSWSVVSPISDTGPYSSNDMELNAMVTTQTLYLRLRRTVGTTTATVAVRIIDLGFPSAFTSTSATGTDASALVAYPNQAFVSSLTSSSTKLTGALTLAVSGGLTASVSGNTITLGAASGTITGSGTANQVAYFSGANALASSASFTWSGTTLAVTGAFTATTHNGLTLTAAADGFTVAGGTTSRTLSVTGGNITLSGGGNTLTLGGALTTVGTFSSGGNFSSNSTVTINGVFQTYSTFSTSGTFSTGGNFSTAGALSFPGAFVVSITSSAATAVTLPVSGTLLTSTPAASQLVTGGAVNSNVPLQVKASSGTGTPDIAQFYSSGATVVNTAQGATAGVTAAGKYYGDGSLLTGVVASGSVGGTGTLGQIAFFSGTSTLTSSSALAISGSALNISGSAQFYNPTTTQYTVLSARQDAQNGLVVDTSFNPTYPHLFLDYTGRLFLNPNRITNLDANSQDGTLVLGQKGSSLAGIYIQQRADGAVVGPALTFQDAAKTTNMAFIGGAGGGSFTGYGIFGAIANPSSAPTLARGTIASGSSVTYYYQYTAVSGTGETALSPEASIAVGGSVGSGATIIVSWAAIPGAESYNVYRANSSGSERKVGTSYTNTFTDGSNTFSIFAPSAVNTTGYVNAASVNITNAQATDSLSFYSSTTKIARFNASSQPAGGSTYVPVGPTLEIGSTGGGFPGRLGVVFAASERAGFYIGDSYTGWFSLNGGQADLKSYWTMVLSGNSQAATAIALGTSPSSMGVLVNNTQATSIGLVVAGPTGQSADLQEWWVNGSPVGSFTANCSFSQKGAASIGGYLFTNSSNMSSTTSLNPGVLVYNGGSSWGLDLGYNNSTYRTRIFAASSGDIALSYCNPVVPTGQSSFTDILVARSTNNCVGINNTSPAATLHVNSSASTVPVFAVQGASGGQTGDLAQFRDTTGSYSLVTVTAAGAAKFTQAAASHSYSMVYNATTDTLDVVYT